MRRDALCSIGKTRLRAVIRNVLSTIFLLVFVAACAETQFVVHTAKLVSRTGELPPSADGTYKVGNPYQIAGVWYYPAEDFEYNETGIASWYGPGFDGKQTANGEIYDMNELTAAHRTLPMPSLVRVINLDNGRGIVLKVNDRGPFAHGRIIDVSRRAAQLLGFEIKGTARVQVQIMADESRAIVSRLLGGRQVAANETPITVDRIPKPAVNSSALPPPPGARSASSPQIRSLPAPARPTQVAEAQAAESQAGQVEFGTPSPGQIYIQAGAFSFYNNANKVRAKLNSLGSVDVSQTLINGRDLFRVRLGPIVSVDQADVLLERVIASGYPDARIIVD